MKMETKFTADEATLIFVHKMKIATII